MTSRILLPAVLAILAFSPRAFGQAIPPNFYNRGQVLLYQPVIDVVTSGAQVMAAPVVSPDRKYVTLTIRPELSHVVRLQPFSVSGLGGYVGGFNPPAQPAANTPAPPPAALNAPLARPGMTRLQYESRLPPR